jgi:hypothetical protein
MDTARLRVLRTLPELQGLLRSFLLDQKLVAPETELFGASSEMPSELRDAMDRAERDGRVWSVWRKEGELAAVSAQLDEDGSRAHGRPVLVLFLHDAAGRVIGSTSWLEAKPGAWTPAPAP